VASSIRQPCNIPSDNPLAIFAAARSLDLDGTDTRLA
jgi:hypothetical protein